MSSRLDSFDFSGNSLGCTLPPTNENPFSEFFNYDAVDSLCAMSLGVPASTNFPVDNFLANDPSDDQIVMYIEYAATHRSLSSPIHLHTFPFGLLLICLATNHLASLERVVSFELLCGILGLTVVAVLCLLPIEPLERGA